MYTTHRSLARNLWQCSLAILLAASSLSIQALDFGVDPYNLGKGDHIYFLSTATNRLGGNVSSVVNVSTLMNYEKSLGMQFIVIKAGTGSTNFPSNSNKQVTTSVINAAHAAGLKIFAYTRSYGDDVVGEINLAKSYLALGCDGWVIDAEIEWESSRQGTQGPAKAIQLCQGIKSAYPNRFLGHAPHMYISLHSSFPYKEFGFYCDAVMPQAYWHEFGISPSQCFTDMETQWRNWQNGLTGTWTNAIKPIAPIAQGWNMPASEIGVFVNALKTASNPATWKGYKSVSYWRADLHTSAMWTEIMNGSILKTNAATISGVSAGNISSSSATIFWGTDISADSVVNYGLTTSYGTTVSDATMVVRHAVNLTGLSPSTTYNFRVKSKNMTNTVTTSGNFTFTTLAGGQVNDIIIDNTQATVVGSWSTASSSTDKYAGDYRYKGQGNGSAYLQFTPNILTAGDYKVWEWHPQGSNRSIDTPHIITYNGPTTTAYINQQVNGGDWRLIGTFNFVAGTSGSVRITDGFSTSGQIAMADAIKFTYEAAPPFNNASVVSSTFPSSVTPGQTFSATVVMNNNGTKNWVAGAHALGSQNPQDNSRWGLSRVSVAGTITPGQNSTFNFNCTAPTTAGTYAFDWKMLEEGVEWFGATAAGSIVVASPGPNAPSGLTATAVSSTQINLTWTDNSSDESGFRVERSTDNVNFTQFISLSPNATSTSSSGLNGSTTYYFRVRAYNASGNSTYSATASATTQPVADIILDNPSATVVGSWTTGTISTDKYQADYRYKGAGTGAAHLTFTPNILVAGNYLVYEWHPQGSNRTTAAPHVISYNGGSQTLNVNQQINGGGWRLLGTFNFTAGTAGYVRITDNFTGTGLNVMADGIRLVYVP